MVAESAGNQLDADGDTYIMVAESAGKQLDAEGDTYMSDESSFYGDENQRASLERRALAFDPQEYWSKQHLSLASIAAAGLAREAPPLLPEKPFNPHAGMISGRQLSESIPDFLTRLPPRTTPQSQIGPWIFIANPYTPIHPLSQNLTAFTADGAHVLAELRAAITAKEAELAGRPQSLLARQLTSLRQSATEYILASATHHGITTGKWMLFPQPADVDAVWRTVAHATASNELGCEAKVATAPDSNDGGAARLICIYTKDFADKEDVRRIAQSLNRLGLAASKGSAGKLIYYKPDAFTHLDIGGGNPWGLKPSLFSSKDALAWVGN